MAWVGVNTWVVLDLALAGACLASAGTGSDPSALVINAFGAMAVPVLLLSMHGPIATNILNLYSCSLAALSIGVDIARWKLTLAAGIVASAVLVIFVRADSFGHAFDNWMVSILVWISPWAAIVAVDYLILRRGRLDIPGLYAPAATSPYGQWNARVLISLTLGLLAGALYYLTSRRAVVRSPRAGECSRLDRLGTQQPGSRTRTSATAGVAAPEVSSCECLPHDRPLRLTGQRHLG